MARGNLYEIEANIENIGRASVDYFYDYAQFQFEYIGDADDPETDIEMLLEHFKSCGMKTGTEKHNGKEVPYVEITDSGRKKYFNYAYQEFVKMTKDLTLDAFIDDNTSWKLRNFLDDNYSDAVTNQNDEFQTFDRFMRFASGRYYIGNVFYMH